MSKDDPNAAEEQRRRDALIEAAKKHQERQRTQGRGERHIVKGIDDWDIFKGG